MSNQQVKLMTPANIVTLIRLAATPLWIWLAESMRHVEPTEGIVQIFGITLWLPALWTFLGFVILSSTDKLDGYLARSRNEVSDFGKFIDPIADKLVVVMALCFLIELNLTSIWVVLVVCAREFVVSGLRMVLASKGEVVAASNLGKAKTAITMIAICMLLLAWAISGPVFYGLYIVGRVSMAAAVLLTIWSGIDYFVKGYKFLI